MLITSKSGEILSFNTSGKSFHWKYAAYAEYRQTATCVRVPQHWLTQSVDSILPQLHWAQGLAHWLKILCVA